MKVAVAVIVDKNQRILITRRPAHASHGGMWEFPGGKLEEGEAAEQALCREIDEEVGIQINKSTCLGEINHQYPHRTVTLVVFLVDEFTGLATCREKQMGLCWVPFEQLSDYSFPEANYKIVQLLKAHASFSAEHSL
ncbi:8-oxo-dGTP diphosphatase MutT [Legionella sp. MW5194]|uniref:8-oxo-dGTP diphosphatase MutT n=1 Tax=Legionella sp. MW5194 TaxID=2662448 RepID=UPI00193D713B|nr:8-oxo-dGTP diphosphatase MutT [Legionella sp. MW5194]QRN03883.1 8-oxo-dGTP diphosphatase MutT [Legionella sp. MW5194]